MDVTDLFLILFYGVAVFFVILFLSSLLQKQTSPPPQIIVIDEQPVLSSWWSFPITSYNSYPYWTGWWSGGGNGGYYPNRWRPHPHHPLQPIATRPWGRSGRHANTGGFHKSRH